MPIIEVKDVGRIQFPDEMTDEEISQRLSEDFGNGPQDGALMRAGKNIVGSALNIAASVPDSVAIIADKIGNTFPSIDEGKSFNELTTHKIAEGIRNLAPKPQGDAPTGAKGFLTEDVPNAIGSVLGIMAGGAAGRIAKLPTWLGGVAAGAMSGGVDGYDDAKAHGADDDTAFKSFLINAGIGTTDEIPIMNWIKKSGTQPLIRRIIEGGSEEALQEFGQQVASNITAGQLYDPDRPWLEGAASASGAGFTVGALFSALTNAILGRRAKQAKNGVKEIADAGAPATAAAVQEIESPIHDGQKVKDNNLIEGVVHDGQVVRDNPNLQLKTPIDVKQGDASVPEVKLETLDKSTQDAISAIESEITQHQSKVGLDTPVPSQETKPAAQPADAQAPVEQTAPAQTQTESTPQPQAQVQEQAQPQQPEKPAAPQVSTVDDAISQVNEAVKSVDEKLKKHLGQIQIVNLPEGSSGIMSAPRAGQNVILIDPPKLKASLDAGMDLRTAIEEETIHNLTGDALKLMAKEEGNKANQQQYWDEQMGKVADEMTQFEKQWVQEKYGKPLEGPQLGAEFVRMVMQEKLRGDITEANYRRRSKAPTLHKILRNFLRFARKSLGLTLASKSAKQIVGRVETIVRQGRQNDRSQKTMEVGGSDAEVGTRGDQINQPDPHPPQPSPVTGGNPRVAAEPSIQAETGTGDSGRVVLR